MPAAVAVVQADRPMALDEGRVQAAGVVRAGGGLRAAMPESAALIDELRAVLGVAWVDDLLRRTARGEPLVYLAEVGADGQMREWGRPPSGVRAVVAEGRVALGLPAGRAGVVGAGKVGWGVPPYGSFRPGSTAGNSARASALATGPWKSPGFGPVSGVGRGR